MRIGFIARPVEADFAFAAEHKIPCIEFNVSDRLDLLDRSTDINLWRQKYDVALSHVGLFGRDYLSADAAEREQNLADLRLVAEFAHAVGCPLVTTGGGGRPREGEQPPVAECVQRLSEIFPAAVSYIEGLGLRLAFYNCHWGNFVTGPDAWGPLLELFPTVGLKFDPSHPLYDGEDWLSQMAEWGDRFFHTHAKDTMFVAGKPFEDVPAGLGVIPWGQFMGMLHHHNYTGDVNIEPHSKTWTGERLQEGILLARNHLAQFLPPPTVVV